MMSFKFSIKQQGRWMWSILVSRVSLLNLLMSLVAHVALLQVGGQPVAYHCEDDDGVDDPNQLLV